MWLSQYLKPLIYSLSHCAQDAELKPTMPPTTDRNKTPNFIASSQSKDFKDFAAIREFKKKKNKREIDEIFREERATVTFCDTL